MKNNNLYIVGSSKFSVYFLHDYLNNHANDYNVKCLENSLFFKEINENYINCKWINIVENPLNVLYSMFYFNENLNYFEFEKDEDKHLCYCFYKWNYSDSINDFNKILHVSFENLNIEKLSNYLSFSLDYEKYKDMFENINIFYENSKMQHLKRMLKKRNLYDFVLEKVYNWYKLQKLVKFI